MATLAIVTGANRGIGLEVCRQLAERGYEVILGARDVSKGEHAAHGIGGSNLYARRLDVSDAASIDALRDEVARRWARLDVLVNNAAIHYDTWQRALNADFNILREAFETNTLGALRMAQAFAPLLRNSEHPRIVNVSSEGGSLAGMGGGTPAYSISKAALNAVTRMLAAELRGVLVNSICPGWVATDMGGRGGRPVAQGAAGIVWAATLPDDGPTGGFFRDRQPLRW